MTGNFIDLCSQLKNIQDEGVLKSKFKDIANELFSNHHIDCCGTIFYFAEVEFYYYRNNVGNKSNSFPTLNDRKRLTDEVRRLFWCSLCFS